MFTINDFVDWIAEKNGKYILIVLNLILVATCIGLGAFDFSSKTIDSFTPTSSLESYDAYNQFNANFASFLSEDFEVIYIKSYDESVNIVNADSAEICTKIVQHISETNFSALVSYDWYYKYSGTNLDVLAQNYLNDNQTGMVFVLKLDTEEPTEDFISDFRKYSDNLNSGYPNYWVIMTGRLTTQAIEDEKTGKGFAIADGAGLPFIALIFWFEVGSFRLLTIPVVALFFSLVYSYGLGLALLESIDIPSYEPNIMLFLCLALSIDYSFFLLTRFQEERRNREDFKVCVVRMLRHSGAIVGVSGLILVITWFALYFFPVVGLDSVGICSALTVLMCIVSNLLLTPVLLLTFDTFYSRAGFSMFEKCRNCKRRQEIESYLLYPTSEDDEQEKKREENCYGRVARVITQKPWSIVLPVVVFVLFLVGCLELRDLELALGANINFGDGAANDAYSEIIDTVNSGVFQTPFAILATTTQPDLFYQAYFTATCLLAQNLTKVNGVVLESIGSIAAEVQYGPFAPFIGCIDVQQAQSWLNTPDDQDTNESALYKYYVDQYNNGATNQSSLLVFGPDFNPFSSEVESLVSGVRDQVNLANQQWSSQGVQFWFYHPMCVEVDAKDFTFERFPYVLTGVLVLVFLLIAARFKAAIVPLKLFFTVVVPIFFVYGIAVTVYQKGGLDWTNIKPFQSTQGGISWLLPCSNVFLLIGLALDYDIFLFSRVYEYRIKGHMSTRQCIVEAVSATGPIISGAGIIMSLAFLGMLANSNTFLNQFGFIMILGVLLDTFVVRVVLVPAILSLGDWLNWWPSVMPRAPPEEGEMSEDQPEEPHRAAINSEQEEDYGR